MLNEYLSNAKRFHLTLNFVYFFDTKFSLRRYLHKIEVTNYLMFDKNDVQCVGLLEKSA